MKTPFYTVIIPTYNRAEMLLEAIQSVLDQTFKNFELIVVDDHSSDNTKEAVISIKDERIIYIINDHSRGPAGARNAGGLRARGEWIAFLDSDDVWLPNKLELQYQQIHHLDNSTRFIYAGYSVYDFVKKQEIYRFIPEKEGWISNDLLYQNYIGATPTVVMKMSLFKEIEGFDERLQYFEDGEFYFRAAEKSKISFLKGTLVYIRNSHQNRLGYAVDKRLHGYQLFWEKHRQVINKSPRLHHRAASRVFVFALSLGEMRLMLKSFPWTLAGLLVDIKNFYWVVRWCFALYFNKLKNIRFIS